MNRTIIVVIFVIALLSNAVFAFVIDHTPKDEVGGSGGNGNGGDDNDDDGDGDDDGNNGDDDYKDFITLELSQDETESVEIANGTHRITLIEINGDTVHVEVKSEPQQIELEKDVPGKVYVEGDYYLTLLVKEIGLDTIKLEIRSFEKLAVRVPLARLGDEYRYDFKMYAEMYHKNLTTGNYSKYTLDSDGSWADMMDGPWPVESGYGDPHECIMERHLMNGHFKLTLDSTETGKISVDGEFNADTKEYVELEERKTIKSENKGIMEVKYLPKAKIKIPVKYEGTIRYYPEPSDEQMPTISEEIYIGKKVLEGDSGHVDFPGSSEFSAGRYNWTAERGETFTVGGEKKETLLVNITSNFWYDFDFQRKAWISDDHPCMIKEIFRTNTSYEDEDEIFWLIFEERRMLLDYTPGGKEIPWGESGVAEYPARHATGEYEKWDKIPGGGYLFDDESDDPGDMTVQMAPEDALEYAMENSEGLKDFLKKYPNAYAGRSKYNATLQAPELNDKIGSHVWNFSLQEYMNKGDARDHEESNDEWPEKRYVLRVAKNITRNPNPLPMAPEYNYEQEIDKDYGKLEGWSHFKRNDLDTKGCTLSGAIDIIKTDTDAMADLFDSDGNLDLKDLAINVGEGATAEQAPGTEIVEALTGLNMPYTKYTWTFQRASLYESGDTFIISVDVETGRLVQVTKLEGNEMMGLFDF